MLIDGHSGPLTGSVLHLFHRTGQVADELFAEELAGLDLTPRQYAVLTILAEQQNASQTEIVASTGIDRSTLADIVKRLVDRGLLARRRSKFDARAYSVRLTLAGLALIRDTAPLVTRVEERLLKSVPPSQRSDFIAALNGIIRCSLRRPRLQGTVEQIE